MQPEFVLDEREDLPAEYVHWRVERGQYCGDPNCEPMGIWACIPDYMRESLAGHLLLGRPTGGFLTALLNNDLMDAINRADDVNLRSLRSYGAFLYNYGFKRSYGSVAAVKAWQLIGGILGIEAEARAKAKQARAS